MKANGKAGHAKSVVKLFKRGAAVCELVGFRSVDEVTQSAMEDPLPIRAACCFTVPVDAPVDSDESAVYELVFDNGARFPIRIRKVIGRDVSAELI